MSTHKQFNAINFTPTADDDIITIGEGEVVTVEHCIVKAGKTPPTHQDRGVTDNLKILFGANVKEVLIVRVENTRSGVTRHHMAHMNQAVNLGVNMAMPQ